MVSFVALRLLAAAVFVSPSPTASPTPVPQIAHVVTSDRSDETLHNTVRTTYVVTSADIQRNGYRTVADALANVPGVEIESYGPIGANANYGIRGASTSETLVLVDGVPAPGSLADSVQLGAMPTTGVERIEVVEGGGSTLYGAGSIGGIINIITDGSHAPASAQIGYGTFDDREFRVQDDGFSYEHVNANNSYALPPYTMASPSPTTRSNSDYEENTVRYGLDRTLGVLGIGFRASVGADDLGADGVFPDYSPTSREHDVNEVASLDLSLRNVQSQATATFFGSRQLITFGCTDVAALDPNCFQNSPSLDAENRLGLDLRNIVNGANERLIYGVDLSRGFVFVNDGDGNVTNNGLDQTAAYAQETWTSDRNELYAGLRGERDGSLGGEFSPSLGERFAFTDALSLKLNAATAFRAPDASELYFPNYGNPNLHPERAVLGDATLSDSQILGGVSLGWFDNYTKELIVLDPSNNYLPYNVGHARMEGFTFDGETLPFNSIRLTFNATDLYAAQDLDTQTRLPNDAVTTVNVGLRWDGTPNSLVSQTGISERVVGARGAVDFSQPLFYQPSAYSDLDAYLRLRVTRGVLLSIRGSNLGNERFAEVAGYPMPGRTLLIDLSTSNR